MTADKTAKAGRLTIILINHEHYEMSEARGHRLNIVTPIAFSNRKKLYNYLFEARAFVFSYHQFAKGVQTEGAYTYGPYRVFIARA